MRALEEENIVAYKYLEQVSFGGLLSGEPISRIPFDYVIKMTIKRSYEDVGGQSGNTQNPGVTERWTKIHYHIVALREHLDNRMKTKNTEIHVELGTARME